MKESNDILVLFEALNNHEIFTPPSLANKMLDLLPSDVWNNPELKFLDPCAKSGVFLREMFFRLFEGLKDKGQHKAHDGKTYNLNNKQERIDHILKNMLYGIATSELTGYVSRRTLYGVMEANSDKQEAALESFIKSSNYTNWSEDEQLRFVDRNKFNDYYNHKIFNTDEYKGFEEEGNIFYPADEVAKKVLDDGKYEVEDMYFPFINKETKHQKILEIKEGKMKFDVIIGNPPYQISDGGGKGASANAIYNFFIENAIALNPKYLSMIIPSRWTQGGRGLDGFRERMLKDRRIKIIIDFKDASVCFPGVDIRGGINYFLWDRNYNGKCDYTLNHKNENNIIESSNRERDLNQYDIFIRDNSALEILEKVFRKESNSSGSKTIFMNNSVYPRWTFSMDDSLFINYKTSPFDKSTKFYGYSGKYPNGIGYINRDEITRNIHLIDKHKVCIPKAVRDPKGKSFYVEPNCICTGTYLVAGNFNTKEEALNLIEYLNLDLVNYLIKLRKITQNTTKDTYTFVPLLDMSIKWTNDMLYSRYSISTEEIKYIQGEINTMGKLI